MVGAERDEDLDLRDDVGVDDRDWHEVDVCRPKID